MPLVDCPHCYTSVITSQAGICPACRKNVNDAASADPSRVLVSISMADLLPGVCHQCGQSTDRTVYVAASRNRDGDAPSPWVAALTTIFSLLLSPVAVFWTRSGAAVEVSLHLPQCSACAASLGRPKPDFVNFQRGSMTFIVDKRFRQALQNERD